MKKNPLSFDDSWSFAAADAGDGAAAPASVPADDRITVDDGDSFPVAAETLSVVTVSAPKPVASIATLADYLINGFWQYNSTPAHHFASHTISYNISGLNSSEQFLAQTALQAWSEVANISFVQTSGSANITFSHNGTMQAYTTGDWPGGAISYQIVNVSTDWVTTDGGANDNKTGIDSYAYQTYLHEIGHALGLGHQGPYNGSASYAPNAIYANDTWQYSLMSYFSEPNYSGSSYRYVITPQMADIYAVVAMYGAQTTTRTGDTVYGFNSNAGAVFSFGSYSPAPALTIYDSNGNDTLDCSGYSMAQAIDLHSGAFSSVGGLVNNIGIALNAIIEKAIGGSGNDTLIANNSGCTLKGGGGNDMLTGGTGSDTALYTGTKSNYTITYNAGTQTFTIVDNRGGSPDGSDTASGIEYFQFADVTITGSSLIGPPNLSTQIFLGSSSAMAGSAVSISAFVTNYGVGSAAASTSRIYLSTDANITTSDVVLATISSGALAAVGQSGYYDAQNLSVTLPGNLAPGTYYIGAIADYDNQIAESNETDNTYNVAQITVGAPPPPNLSAQVYLGSSSAAAGSAISINTFVVNYGNGAAASSSSRVYLSTDATITTSDIVLGTISTGALAAVGQSGYYSAQNLNATLPANLAPGTYYIGAIADYGNQIAESNETDNTYNIAQITVTGGASPPNLSAQVFTSSSSSAAGLAVSVNTFVVNYGAGAAASSTTKVYLSIDPNITTSDTVLGTISTGALAAVGQSGYYSAQNLAVTLPANLAPGTYYIGAIADYDNQVAESNETDNTYNVAPIVITGSAALPNLSAQVFPGSSSAAAGSVVSVNTFVVNYGAGAAASSTSKVYLSTDPNITTSDIVLGTISAGALAAVGQSGYYSAQNLAVTLPANLAPGTYYIGAIADDGNLIAESNETDNTYNVAAITVTTAAPSLSAATNPNAASIADSTFTAVASPLSRGDGPTGTGATSSSAHDSDHPDNEGLMSLPMPSIQQTAGMDKDGSQAAVAQQLQKLFHSAPVGSSPTEHGSVEVASFLSGGSAAHSAFVFASGLAGTDHDAQPLSHAEIGDAFGHTAAIHVDAGLTERSLGPFEAMDGSSIHDVSWDIAQHHSGEFIIR